MLQLRITLIFLLWAFTLGAQQYHFKNYSLNEGLPQSQVFALCEDHRGYIWMGTNGGGLAMLDGLEFTTYTTRDGLNSNYILSLCEDHNGTIWIGTDKGISTFDGRHFRKEKLPAEGSAVNVIIEDSEQNIWIGTNKGVLRKKGTAFETFKPEIFKDDPAINFIAEAPGKAIWIGTDQGIYISEDTSITRLTTRQGLSNSLTQCMTVDAKGTIWVGNYGRGLDRITGNDVENFGGVTGLERAAVFDILCDEEGFVWIATQEQGLCKFNPKDSSTVFLNEKDGLANNHVRSLLLDRWGNYWIGTSGGGVSKYSGQQFERFGQESGLPGSYIYSVTAGPQNELWAGTSGGGIARYYKSYFTHFGADSGFVNEKVRALFVDSDSLLWIGTEGKGLAVFDGDTFRFFTVDNGLAGNWVKSVMEDPKGRIWAASAGGGITLITKQDSLNSLKFQKFTTRNGLKDNRIIYLHIDKRNRVWFASQNSGTGYIENDSTIVNFSTKDGLASNDIRSIAEDDYGNLWIGSTGGLNAIPLYQEDLIIRTIPNEELRSINIYQLIIDHQNQLWVGTEKGLDRLKIDSSLHILESVHFGSDEGFRGVETNLNAACTDQNHNLWFGTVDGLYKYLSQADVRNETPPVLNLREISLNYVPLEKTSYGDSWRSSERLQFKHDENHLTFDFLGVTQTIPKKVHYKWRLLGLEENWSPASRRNSVSYSNLAPGQYTFQLLAANENGVWNPDPLEFTFEIEAPFWQTAWFRIAVLFATLLLIILMAAVIIKRINRKSHEQQQKLKMERDLIGLEQKALRLQMNPHFIFHTLNSIQELIATKDEETARVYLSKFSKLMRQILENSRSNEISLETEIDTLRSYLSIERFCHEEKFDFTMQIEGDLETELILIPPMILQPFVENAIIHGVQPLGNGGQITIAFVQNDRFIDCTITDNGAGRKEASARMNPGHKSTAMEVTGQRLSMLNRQTESVIIEDLFDENNKPAGTKVLVKLPIIDKPGNSSDI